MITKNECLSMLMKLEEQKGINVDKEVSKVLVAKTLPIDVLKFINSNQGIEAVKFYDMLRRSHNKNKSPLYTNIMNTAEDEPEIITTMSSLIQQITLYSRKLDESERALFFKEIRADEASKSLSNYFSCGNYIECKNILSAIKNDILVLEYIDGRREAE